METFSQYCQQLTEGRDAPLFHGTPKGKGFAILSSGKLSPYTQHSIRGLNKWDDTPIPQNEFTHRFKYRRIENTENIKGISLTRSYSYAHYWVTKWLGHGGFILQLNQRKLSQRYKIIPYHYANQNGLHPTRSPERRDSTFIGSEYEEFLLTNKDIDIRDCVDHIFYTDSTQHFTLDANRFLGVQTLERMKFEDRWLSKMSFDAGSSYRV